METFNDLINESTEYVFEEIGRIPNAKILRFAPVTRVDGCTWVHPTYAREATFDDMKKRASVLWRVTSLWNPGPWKLVWKNAPVRVLSKLAK